MKFGKVLKTTSENMPAEMMDLFLRYKELKKMIKAIPAREAAQEHQGSVSVSGSASASGGNGQGHVVGATALSVEEQQFISTLNEDLARFNRYFIEKEEDAVIRLQALSDELETHTTAAEEEAAAMGDDAEAAAAAASSSAAAAAGAGAGGVPGGGAGELSQPRPARDALQASKAALVQFHGELVLLLHWSLLNYAAVVKILKKHDKRTGVLLRAPYLANVLQQPFSSTTIMSRLAKRAEELVVHSSQLREAPADALAEPLAAAAAGEGGPQQQQQQQHEPAEAQAGPAPRQQAQAQPQPAASSATTLQGVTASDTSTLTHTAQHLEQATAAAGGAGPAAHADDAGAGAGQSGRQAPLVGRTMHALQTWANLRKNAITPSTVLSGPKDNAARKRNAEEVAGGVEGSEVPGQEPDGSLAKRSRGDGDAAI